MPRSTDTDVRAYVDVPSDVLTTPYISAASVVADAYLSGSGLSEPILTQIEIFLAAHFATLAVERGGLTREQQGQSSESYQMVSTRQTGLASTRFGQQALALDSTGTLAAVGSTKLRALFTVVGSASVDVAS
jgi:hypothetical protein